MNLIDLYNKKSRYDIVDHIQEIPLDVDIETLRSELFNLIIKNDYGTNVVSLKLPEDRNDWIDQNEKLEDGSVLPFALIDEHTHPKNDRSDVDYVKWHPDVSRYLKQLTQNVEEMVGQKIGRVRLAWLDSHKGYPIHADTDPMRIHIPIFTNNLAYIIHDGKIHNFKYGKIYHLITPSTHTAWNFGNLPRLHLIFSTHADQEITNRITENSSLDQTKRNIQEYLSNSGVDTFSMAKLIKIKGLTPKDTEFGFIKRMNDILEGKE